MTNTINLSMTDVVPADNAALFANLQGNILSGHGRNFSRHVFVSFKPGKESDAKVWVSGFAKNTITSAADQEQQRAEHVQNGKSDAVFSGLYLSTFGYTYFGFGDLTEQPTDGAFRQGMSSRKDLLGDSPSSQWEPGFQSETQAMILLACDNESLLNNTVQSLQATIADFAVVNTIQSGAVLRNDNGQVIEPFGFADGVSNPEFLHRKMEQSNNVKFDTRAPLSVVLTKDPHGGDTAYGSYVVYRKLSQDIDGWNKEVVALASKLDIQPALAGAYAVGRFQDGTPLVEAGSPQNGPLSNNFNYEDDKSGSKCPFHAHIRKTNPRGQTETLFPGTSLSSERDHRIARRAIAYGSRENNTAGLLFICMQSSIVDQFEFIQSSWANANHFIKQNVGQDTVIGQGKQVPGDGQEYPVAWGDDSRGFERFDFKLFVELKGGEYFFAPSIEFLKNL